MSFFTKILTTMASHVKGLTHSVITIQEERKEHAMHSFFFGLFSGHFTVSSYKLSARSRVLVITFA